MKDSILSVTDEPHSDLWSRVDDEINLFGLSCLIPYQPRHIGSYLHYRGELVGGCNGLLIGAQLHVTGLWTTSDIRRHGLGKKLLGETMMKAKDMGCCMAFLDTENELAKKMYEDMGFTCLAVVPGFIPRKLRSFFSKKI